MRRIEGTVFISYQRTNFYTALAVYQSLSLLGFNVFMEGKRAKGKYFSEVVRENIKSRVHFLIIISPSAMEVFQNFESCLRKEIELAIDEKRNIIPLVMESFDASSPSVRKAISGKLVLLENFRGVRLFSEYFYEGMKNLRERCLSAPFEDNNLSSFSIFATTETAKQKKIIEDAPLVPMKKLVTEEWFERGVALSQRGVFIDAIHAFSEALRARPNFAEAYCRRGRARGEIGDFEGAIADFEETLTLYPDFVKAYLGRGVVQSKQSNFKQAVEDFNQALKIQPNYADAFYHRGNARGGRGDIKGAIADYDEAIRIQPGFAAAYNNRGLEYYNQSDFAGAQHNYDAAIHIEPDLADAYNNRGLVRGIQNDLEGAIDDFAQAVHIQPDFAGAYYNRATLWKKKREYKAAIIDYQKYLKLNKGIPYRNQVKIRRIIQDLKKKIK